ncbi:IS630 family transposase [Pseudonocardia parietis]|uniref:Transposase n=1 Tax=Pseudonocardia parietis TaxID=570936 RepID=A0ABS4W639_9PSEU|nr:IS630 family transposase [Pseudonocardia parietis]MBP2371635.1 transposase [Pseudonocardia parietis]
MSTAARLEVRSKDRKVLQRWLRSTSIPAGLAQRARIVLLAGDGIANAEIGRQVGASRPTVLHWRGRYLEGGVAALHDRPRSGRPREVDEIKVVTTTLADGGTPPEQLGVTHWSARLLAAELGTSFATVARIWRDWDLQPWRTETFTFSTDPELEAKVRDIVGLYLHPPQNAVVLCVDEKSQVQALDRTQPTLPIRPGDPERQAHDYIRHGTTTLFAALEVATGKVTDACFHRHRHQEFLRFLKQVAKAYPRVKLHVVCDNYSTHKHPTVKAWLERNPRITLHFTPTSGSWLNLIEVFFGIITRQAIRRGSYGSVRDLVDAIRRFIDGWNERCEPFTWTKDADTILAKANRQTTSNTRH